MRRNKFTIIAFAAILWANLCMTSCHDNKKTSSQATEDNTETSQKQVSDSTVYGICGEGSAMHTLELITDEGDTIEYAISDEGDMQTTVQGGMFAGDRMAVIGTKINNENVATKVINLTALLGKWTSIDKNFEIQEGGTVKSDVKAESHPWTSWQICNGKLLLNKDTFDIDVLGPDSLCLENHDGIFAYKRIH